jgi:hypothetical protein
MSKPDWVMDEVNGTNDLVCEIDEMIDTLIDWAKEDWKFAKEKENLYSADARLQALLRIKNLIPDIKK